MAASLGGASAQVSAELGRERAELEEEKRALKRARTELDGEIEAMTKIGVSDEDILELNVAGEIIIVKRGTLSRRRRSPPPPRAVAKLSNASGSGNRWSRAGPSARTARPPQSTRATSPATRRRLACARARTTAC